MTMLVELDSFQQELLSNSIHSPGPKDPRRELPMRVSFKEAQEILQAHTVVQKDETTGLYFHTVDGLDSYKALFKAMNRTYMASVGMHLIFWPCGKALVRAIQDNKVSRTFFENKRILGVCSGSGLTEVFLAKNLGAELVVSSDHDIFSRAICHLNAELNEVSVGTNFVVSNESMPAYLWHNETGYFRLYDTVLVSDFRYAVGQGGSQELLSYEVLNDVRSASCKGMDAIVSEVDYAELYEERIPNLADYHRRAYKHDGLLEDTVVAHYQMDYDQGSLRLGLEPRQEFSGHKTMPVRVHYWPAQKSRRSPLKRLGNPIRQSPPLLGNRWWTRQSQDAVILG